MEPASQQIPRVCFASIEYPPDWGGVSKSARRIVRMLVEGGFEVHVFAPMDVPEDGACEVDPVAVDGVTLYRVPTDRAFSPSSVLAFFKAIDRVNKTLSFDIFHGFYLPMAHPCLPVAAKAKRPVVASIRGDDGVVLLKGDAAPAMAKVLREAAWITSVSSDSLQRANTLVNISRKSSFIPNSIQSRDGPHWCLTEENRGVVGTVCTFRPKKNIPLLIESYARLKAGLRRKLLLVGDFSEGDINTKTDTLNTIKASGVQSETEITGYVNNSSVSSYMCSMNVFVLSSTHEGFPNTILEAAATGVPIIATAVDGVKDICKGTDHILLVAPEDPVALGAAIESVLEDPHLARKLSAGSLELARRFTPEKEMDCWLELYRQLLG